MSEGYRKLTIDDVVHEIYDAPHATPEKTEEGPIFLGVSNLVNGRLDLSDTEHVSEEGFQKRTSRVTPTGGDIVFSYETRLGEAALIPESLKCCLGRRMGLLRVDREVADPRYLLYAWLSPEFQRTIHAQASQGSTVNRILLTELGDYPIRVPPLPIQRRIADILGALDDKIELNRRMNETLEEMAQTLYRHWFVDFGPFQDREFKDTEELGPIPKGWEVQALDDVASFLNGTQWSRYKPEDENEETLQVIKIKELRNGFSEKSDEVSKEDILNKYIIEDGDVIFSWSGSLLLRIWSDGQGALNQHLFKVSSERFPKWFYYQGIRHHIKRFRRIAESKATTMGHIKRSHLSESYVPVPPEKSMQEIHQQMHPLMQLQIANLIESKKLTETRDYLLPKLISGEIQVDAAEEAVESIS